MGIRLDDLRGRVTWVPLKQPFLGIGLLLKHASPGNHERFRNRMVAKGVVVPSGGLFPVSGRESEYFLEFAREYIHDWRVEEGFPEDHIEGKLQYTAERGAYIIENSRQIWDQVTASITDDKLFFSPSSNGSNPS